MQNKLLDIVENDQLRNDLPEFKSGDNIKVLVRIKEGAKERIQAFEGLVIAIKNYSTHKTFTVRKISNSVGVERTFPLNSPVIVSIEVLRKNKVRRSKLYYMRDLKGKSARLKELKK
ncbi:50S ribosomal protein L19 [[Mycoplasma] mobile]|uniref:Large ribosomal subunit protein bL19 n=1 Tax=Mycoplasma mobile (strain ATCC 43663 / 163K / NCTC 11711) TaxID=267748 RepID=RL19_MYCM1|nr:50S ribosomal protein L19 [[Mycoplasma] mobile]Q6KHL6.1 RecName: Full=Large ribosomal subunit protein bL19; AltName: Full=50S ribosomal protein L19 [Mycoplasma mobile 163K]AAT27914.1 50S ribosomal protein l19 [Mycoplasma mobile 163K]